MGNGKTCPKCHGHGSMPSTPCHVCNGSGRSPANHHINIHIPCGVDTGARLRVPGEGEHGINGGKNGDLYISLDVGQSELFERSGMDLHVNVFIPSVGVGILETVDVPTPYGKKTIKIPKKIDQQVLMQKTKADFPVEVGFCLSFVHLPNKW